jgi:F-type H+-transporting ATPase subunit epsilon
MSKTFNLEIITPTKTINEGEVEYLRAPSYDGLFGVKRGHANATMALDIGEIKVIKNGIETYYSSSSGFADITNNTVEILVESIELSNEIDKSRAKNSADRAKNRLKDKTMDQDRSMLSLQKALNRLKVSKR